MRRGKARLAAIISVLGASVLVVAACAPAVTSTPTPTGPIFPPSGPAVGSLAPDFTVTTLDGQTFTLSQQRGKVVILDFVIAGCPVCRKEIPVLAKVDQDYKGRGVVVVGIDINVYETEADLRDTLQKFGGGDHLWVMDDMYTLFKLYQVTGPSTTTIIDQQGKVTFTDMFPTSYEKFKEEIEKLL